MIINLSIEAQTYSAILLLFVLWFIFYTVEKILNFKMVVWETFKAEQEPLEEIEIDIDNKD